MLFRSKSNIGDDDAMIPLVDMMTCEFLHDIDDIGMSYDSFIFPCDAMLDIHDAHVDLTIFNDIAMPCYDKLEFALIVACNMLNNCSFHVFLAMMLIMKLAMLSQT